MRLKRNEILNRQNHKYFFYFLAAAFIVRLIIAPIIEGHPTDIQCFKSWANHAAANGLFNFYATDMFVDYPPGYIYILYILGKIRMIFSLITIQPLIWC